MKRIYLIAALVLVLGLAPAVIKLIEPAPRMDIDIHLQPVAYDMPIRGAARGLAINDYFQDRKMPLAGYGEYMVAAADRNGIDWRILPAIAIRESSGGIHACGFNPFGYGSCKGEVGKFESWEEAIDVVSEALGSGRYYSGKDLRAKLETYNPPSIVPTYADEVIAIMKKISPGDV